MRILTGHRWSVFAVAFAPWEPTRLATGGTDGTIRLWDTSTGAVVSEHRAARPAEVRALAWAGSVLVVGDRLGQVHRLHEGSLLSQTIPSANHVRAAVAADDAVWLAGDADPLGFVARLSPLTGRLHVESRPSSVRAVLPGVLAEAGRRVVRLDPPIERLTAHEVTALGSLPGPLLAVAQACDLEQWDTLSLDRVGILKGHRSTITTLAISPDGHLLLTGSRDRTVRAWSLPGFGLLACWNWEIGPIHAVAIAPDGLTAAAAGEKSPVIVWDLDFGR